MICIISIKSSVHRTEDHRSRNEINNTCWVLWAVHKLRGENVFSKYNVMHISVYCLFYGPLALSLSLSLCTSAGQEALQTSYWPPFQVSTHAWCHTPGFFKEKRWPPKYKVLVVITACNLKKFSIMNIIMLSKSWPTLVPWLRKGVKQIDWNTDPYNNWWCLIQPSFPGQYTHSPAARNSDCW